jgi:Tol biopolymer transport system component
VRGSADSWRCWPPPSSRWESILTGGLRVADLRPGPDGPVAGEPRILPAAGDLNTDPVWTPMGDELVFTSGRWPRSELWWVAADGSSPPRPLAGGGLGGSEPTLTAMPGADPGRGRLVFSVVDLDNDIWRIELPDDGGADEPERSVRLIASSQRERFPVYSSDGSRIAFLSDRSGHREVWVADAEGRSPVQWTEWRSSYVWRPAWSSDGRFLAYTVQIDGVLRAHLQDGPLATPRALTDDGASDDEIGWSRDGRTLYVGSLDRSAAAPSVWAVDVTGERPPRLVARVGLLRSDLMVIDDLR